MRSFSNSSEQTHMTALLRWSTIQVACAPRAACRRGLDCLVSCTSSRAWLSLTSPTNVGRCTAKWRSPRRSRHRRLITHRSLSRSSRGPRNERPRAPQPRRRPRGPDVRRPQGRPRAGAQGSRRDAAGTHASARRHEQAALTTAHRTPGQPSLPLKPASMTPCRHLASLHSTAPRI